MNPAEASRKAEGARYLFDLVHPANSLFFYHTIKTLEAEGAQVLVASRHKDVLIPLLDEFKIEHVPISRAGSGRFGLGRELLVRDARLLRLVRRFRPDVMTGFGGVAISHVGRLTGIPSVSFYDTEHAGLQLGITLPFISEWHVPECWQGRVAEGRTFRFPGGKQFAYLHPDHFMPSPELAREAGWDPERDNFLLRTVAWNANHDRGRSGFEPERLKTLVDLLSARGKVHISAEGELPPEFEQRRYRGSPGKLHHLLAHCRAYVGESITIASESVMLGVPVLLQIDKEYGYVADQEKAGLIDRLRPEDDERLAIDRLLQKDPRQFRLQAREFIKARGDVNAYILSTLKRVAKHGPSPGPE